MKIGNERRITKFWLGKIEVAHIYHCVSYGVSYIPRLKQTKTVDTYLTIGDEQDKKCKDVEEAYSKLKKLCQGDFDVLQTTEDYKNDIVEKEVRQRYVWGELSS